MARRDKNIRRNQRQKKKRKNAHSILPGLNSHPPIPAGVTLLEYRITDEIIPEPAGGGRDITAVLTESEREDLFAEITDDPKSAAVKLERLLEIHPDVATFYNWLAAAYTRNSQFDKSSALIRINYERNPGYLFARMNYAQWWLQQRKPQEAAAVMDGKFDLKALHPERDVFHITEFVTMSWIAIEYSLQTGHRENAIKMLAALRQVAPDADITRHVGARVEGSPLIQQLRKMSPFANRGLRVSKKHLLQDED